LRHFTGIFLQGSVVAKMGQAMRMMQYDRAGNERKAVSALQVSTLQHTLRTVWVLFLSTYIHSDVFCWCCCCCCYYYYHRYVTVE
jgi:hypothetical protein